MPEYMLIMKNSQSEGDWQSYIESLMQSGKFRGGSAFSNSRCLSKACDNNECVATGYMRFEADSIDEIQALLAGNPTYEAGGAVEIHELIKT